MSECGDDEGRATPEVHESVVGRAGARRGRALLAACAVLVALAFGFPGAGCLNPRPEELPSADFSLPGQPEPVRETCDDNPLLAGCDLPDQDISGEPIDRDDPSPDELPIDSDDAPSDDPGPVAPGSEAAGAAGGAGGDAGSDIPADAGAP